MRHGSSLMAAVLAIALAIIVFEIKSTVREVERETARVRRDIDEGSWRLRTLKADYAYLTRPERLALQARQLGLVPGRSSEMVAVDDIAFATHLAFESKIVPVTLATGEQLELRFKPGKPAPGTKPLAEAAAKPAAPRR